MMSLTFGLFTQVSGSGPLGPLVKNINGSEDPLMHKAEGPSNYFFQLFHTLSS